MYEGRHNTVEVIAPYIVLCVVFFHLLYLFIFLFLNLCFHTFVVTGTKEERGLTTWRADFKDRSANNSQSSVYELPFQSYFNKLSCTRYLPFCNGFRGDKPHKLHMNGHSGHDNPGYESQTKL